MTRVAALARTQRLLTAQRNIKRNTKVLTDEELHNAVYTIRGEISWPAEYQKEYYKLLSDEELHNLAHSPPAEVDCCNH